MTGIPRNLQLILRIPANVQAMSAVNLNSMRVAATDKLIIQHLAEGGAIDDNKGCELVNALVRHGLNDKRMGASAAARRLTHSDFFLGIRNQLKPFSGYSCFSRSRDNNPISPIHR
jgi:hypothetical protein